MQKFPIVYTLMSAILALAFCLASCKSNVDDDPTMYTVTVSSSIEHGKVSVDKTSAEAGATIKLTATADSGYELESYSVKDASENELTVTDDTFTMPESNVTVSATFKATAVTTQKTAGSISYATASVSKTTDDAAFTNALTKTGDGTVTYASSKETVATVNATTGEVTIVGAGETTITATVADSDTYTYAVKTASYTLTVTQAVTALSPAFENGAIVQIKYYWQQAGYETVFNFTNNDGVYSCTCTGTAAEDVLFNGSLIKDDSSLTFSSGESSGDMEAFNFSIVFNSKDDSYKFLHKGILFIRFSISVNGTDITSQLTEKQ